MLLKHIIYVVGITDVHVHCDDMINAISCYVMVVWCLSDVGDTTEGVRIKQRIISRLPQVSPTCRQ